MEKETKKFGSDFSSITPEEYERLTDYFGLELSEVPAYEVEDMLEEIRDKEIIKNTLKDSIEELQEYGMSRGAIIKIIDSYIDTNKTPSETSEDDTCVDDEELDLSGGECPPWSQQ